MRPLRQAALRIPAILLVLAALAPLGGQAETRASYRYAIVVSQQTVRDPGWREVVSALEGKHAGARTFTFERMDDLVAPLQAFSPDYIAFVSRPEETTPGFVQAASRLNRRLGNDPYGLAVWAIVTGYTQGDALRIARHATPLSIRFGLGGTEAFLDALPEGAAWSEFTERMRSWRERRPGQPVKDRDDAPPDHLVPMIELLNGNRVDAVWTSGHAEEDRWSVYYPEGPSFLVAAEGGLTGFHDGERRGSVHSTNPKVYLAVGNCLTARIERPEASYALSWLHAGGANQYFGFIEETGHGLVGWGMADNFFYRGGRFNVAESAFVSNQSLLLAIEKRLAPDEMEDLLHDRDATVVYGDPAWMATVLEDPGRAAEHWSTRLTRSAAGKKIRWELAVTFRVPFDFSPENGRDLRPVFAFLPERVRKPRPVGKPAVQAFHVASNFVIVQPRGKVAAGETRTYVFESE